MLSRSFSTISRRTTFTPLLSSLPVFTSSLPARRFSSNSSQEDGTATLAATLARALTQIHTQQQAKYKAYTSFGTSSIERVPTADVRSFFLDRVVEPISEGHVQPLDSSIQFWNHAAIKKMAAQSAAQSTTTTTTSPTPISTLPRSTRPVSSTSTPTPISIPITEAETDIPSTLSMISSEQDDDITLSETTVEDENLIKCDSTKRKRARKMNRHKHKKRIKRERHMNRKNTAQ